MGWGRVEWGGRKEDIGEDDELQQGGMGVEWDERYLVETGLCIR